MKREEVELQSDRDILIDLKIGQAVLEERTAGWETKIDDMSAKAERNASDISWIKKIGLSIFSFAVAVGGGAVAWFVR